MQPTIPTASAQTGAILGAIPHETGAARPGGHIVPPPQGDKQGFGTARHWAASIPTKNRRGWGRKR